MTSKTRVLILGATGMLGHVLFKRFSGDGKYQAYGTVRKHAGLERYMTASEMKSLIADVDVDNFDSIINAFRISKPDIVVNCIGLIKHLPVAKNRLMAINTNSLLPHKLANLCELAGARMIHISTDCVFDGQKGDYTEADNSNAEDIYGKTKYLGEVDYPHAITLRTSIIGHELQTDIALVDWFLSQENKVKGYTQAIYTGLPTYEIANVIMNCVIPNRHLHGLYQVASDKINKYDLLRLISQIYHKEIVVEPYADFVLDRSLNAERFKQATGYKAPTWKELISNMHDYYREWACYRVKFGEKFI